MKRFVPIFLGSGLCCHAAISMTPVRIYDATGQANAVDNSATVSGGNQIGLAHFKTAVSAAFDTGFGGVLDFENPSTGSVVVNDTFDITYGLVGEKSFSITNTSPTNMNISTNVAGRTPISGVNFLGKSGGTNGDIFDFTFPAAARITAVAATVMSRLADGGTLVGTVTFSDNSTATTSFAQLAGDGTSDIFFGFRTTEAQIANNVFITNLNLNPANFRGLDDLAFVADTFVVPEPSIPLLTLAGAAVFALGRRR